MSAAHAHLPESGSRHSCVEESHELHHPTPYLRGRRASMHFAGLASDVIAMSALPRELSRKMMMRLNSEWVERTLAQYPARLVPDSDPVVPKLIDMFGDHTFFLDNNGLNIVEPAETLRDGVQAGRVVELAHWTDARPPKLVPHEPEPTDLVIELETIG